MDPDRQQDDEKQRAKKNRRLAIILGIIALLFYFGFILNHL
ncbi:MAG: hypothetical protein P8126_07855 [Gammaproteobacteria bacterium]